MIFIKDVLNLFSLFTRVCFQTERLTLHTLFFEQTQVKMQGDARELERRLKEKNIDLIPRICFRLLSPNELVESRINAYRGSFDQSVEVDRLKDRMFSALEIIKMEELNQGVALCCLKVNELVTGRYALGIAKNKSQTFVAELALPYLERLPERTFSVGTDNVSGGSNQSKLAEDITDFVVFDDASYSGKQLRTLINNLSVECDEFAYKKPRLFLVIPFISSAALKILRGMREEGFISCLEIHLITTTKTIKAIRDIFDQKEIETLDEWLGSRYRANTLCLTFTEWKRPDPASVPGKVIYPGYPFPINEAFVFATSHPEEYKTPLARNLSCVVKNIT